jgi:predicted nucleic acid-binding Zn ribbon protein
MTRGPEPLSEILSRLFTARGWGRTQERLRLEQVWNDVSGPEIAPHARVVGLKRGVLEIEVGQGALLHELVSFHKRRLLAGLKEKLPGVPLRDLRFRTGTADE